MNNHTIIIIVTTHVSCRYLLHTYYYIVSLSRARLRVSVALDEHADSAPPPPPINLTSHQKVIKL